MTAPQLPVLGEYDSRDPKVIAEHLRLARANHIDSFLCSWWGVDSYEDVTINKYLIDAPEADGTKFAIVYESLALLPLTDGLVNFGAAETQKLVSDFRYIAETYFGRKNYQVIDGRPVVYVYVSRIYRGSYEAALTRVRSEIRELTGHDVYLVGDEVDWDGSPNAARIKLFDAITAYSMYSDQLRPGWPSDTGYLDGVKQRYTAFKKTADENDVEFIPNAIPGFNDRGVRLEVNHAVLPVEVSAATSDKFTLFSQFIELAGSFVSPKLQMLTLTSWNEWHEDTQLEPTVAATASPGPEAYTQGYTYYSYGSRLLEIVKDFWNRQ